MYTGGFKEDFKNAFSKPNSAHTQLIIINVVIFLVLAALSVFSRWFGFEGVFKVVHDQFSIPPLFSDFIYRPWTIITYGFAHSLYDLLHILFNMLIFYWFAKLIIEYLGSDKVISLYILGTIAGGALYLFVYNVVPFYVANSGFPGMVGASAAVSAIVVAAATLVPNYTFFLLFIGPVRIKYIAAFIVITSFIWSTGSNAGGNVAHLGGALMGYIFVRQLQKGNNWGAWVISVMRFFKSFFVRQSNIKVSYSKKKSTGSARKAKSGSSSKPSSSQASQDEIDAILDKISEKGYESLSKEEKQKLFNASRK